MNDYNNPTMPEISILLLGETDRPEFCDFRSTLESLGRVSRISEVERAIEVLETGEITPDVIVIAQAFPRQFSHQDIDRLRRLAPLSRILGLLGSWCEGETRSGQPLPAAIRIYWHQWHARAERELRRLIQSQCPSWGLPVTATEEERLLQSTAQTLPAGSGTCRHPCPAVCNGRLAIGGLPDVRVFDGLVASAPLHARRRRGGGHFRRFRFARRGTRPTPPPDQCPWAHAGYRIAGFSPHRRPAPRHCRRSGGRAFKAA